MRGSHDETRAIARRFPFATVLDGQDSGIYEGFNRALAACDDQPDETVIGFLNADDQLGPSCAPGGRAFRDEPALAMLSGGTARFEASAGSRLILPQARPLSIGSILFAIPAINARFFRLGFLRQIGPFAPAAGLAADREYLLRLNRLGPRRARLDEALYIYRMHPGSTTLAGTAAARRRVWNAEAVLAEYLAQQPDSQPLELVWARRALALAEAKSLAGSARRPSLAPGPFAAALAPALVSWLRWRGCLSGY